MCVLEDASVRKFMVVVLVSGRFHNHPKLKVLSVTRRQQLLPVGLTRIIKELGGDPSVPNKQGLPPIYVACEGIGRSRT